MNYLEKTLDIKIKYGTWDGTNSLPYMITDRYDFRLAWINDYKTLFVYAKDELDQLAALKKQFQLIRQKSDCPLVLILSSVDARRRQQLINAGIPFVVPEQQIFLPFLGILLQERYMKDYSVKDRLMPSSELLLLYFINNNCQPLYMSDMTKALGFSAMTISRGIRQLESLKLLRTYKDGVNKVIISDLAGRELFEAANEHLFSPVRKTVYIGLNNQVDEFPLSGYSALSEYSMLNTPQVKCYAVNRIPAWATGTSDTLLDSENQVRLEVWNYDPRILAAEHKVGLLPLALALMDDPNERVQQALEESLENYWEEHHG